MEPNYESVFCYSLEYHNDDPVRVERVHDAIKELLEDEPDFEKGNILLIYEYGDTVTVEVWPELCSNVPKELYYPEEFKIFCEINEE